MCVIAICQTRKLTVDEITRMDAANPHGIGVAWINPRATLVEYVKGLTADEAVAWTARVPLPQVVHFRFASVGAITPMLAHPFPLSEAPVLDLAGAALSVLFHNGTWSEWQTGYTVLVKEGMYADPREPWSDSRVIAALMARSTPEKIASLVGEQRLAVLRGTGRIETYGGFVKHQGLLVSNLWWLPRQFPDYTPTWIEEEDWAGGMAEAVTKPVKPSKTRRRGKGKGGAPQAPRKTGQGRPQAAQEGLFDVVPTSTGHRYFPRVPRPLSPSRRSK